VRSNTFAKALQKIPNKEMFNSNADKYFIYNEFGPKTECHR
jgi:hypothetical protein